MRNEYDFSQARRLKAENERRGLEFPPLSKAQHREIDRRVKDLHDPTRFLIISEAGPTPFFYNAAEDNYSWGDPQHASLFKQRSMATAVSKLLSTTARVIQVDTRLRAGARQLIIKSLPVGLKTRRGR